MGKPNKNKNAQHERASKMEIEEPKFDLKSDKQAVPIGDKKLLAQKERERKEQEEQIRPKEKQEEEKKKKNKNKKKSKQGPPKDEEVKKKYTQNENVGASYQDPRKVDNTRYENKGSRQSGGRFQENYSNKKVNSNYQNNVNVRNSYHYTFSDGKNDKEFQKFLHSGTNFNGRVREIKGDLFSAPSDYSLAHCVAEDFSMGAGIATQFRSKFKRISKLLEQNAKTGGLAILEDENRFIYYLVTKRLSRGKPTLYTLWKSLLKLRDHMTKYQVTKLAIPQIGCGLDRLDWSEVKRMLEYIFSENEIEIDVYILDAKDTVNPTRAARKCYVVHVVQPLTDIQAGTGLVFFGSEDGVVSHEMKCLARKFDYLNEYKVREKSIGDAFRIMDGNEYLYALIIRRTHDDQIDYTDAERCLFNLRKLLKTDKTEYIGLQGFVDKDDDVITDKLVNLMQYTLQDVEIWVCWPEELQHLCPKPK